MYNNTMGYTRLTQYDPITNPEPYYQAMEHNLLQPPVQIYPGLIPGSGGGLLYPGFLVGQRGFSQEDAERVNKERQQFMEERAANTDNPAYKYIKPEGNLPQGQQALITSAIATQAAQQEKNKEQQKLIMAVGAGILISLLLRRI